MAHYVQPDWDRTLFEKMIELLLILGEAQSNVPKL